MENEAFKESIDDKEILQERRYSPKKHIILGIIILIFLIILATVLFISLDKSSKDDILGEFICIYNIKNESLKTNKVIIEQIIIIVVKIEN